MLSVAHVQQLYLFPMEKYGNADLLPRDTRKWNEFMRFHENYPEVYDFFVQLAEEAIQKGYRKIGAHLFIQRIRWERDANGNRMKGRVANDHFPYYARMLMAKRPEFNGFFELRKLKE